MGSRKRIHNATMARQRNIIVYPEGEVGSYAYNEFNGLKKSAFEELNAENRTMRYYNLYEKRVDAAREVIFDKNGTIHTVNLNKERDGVNKHPKKSPEAAAAKQKAHDEKMVAYVQHQKDINTRRKLRAKMTARQPNR